MEIIAEDFSTQIVGCMFIGTGFVFALTDRKTRSTWGLAISLIGMGLGMLGTPLEQPGAVAAHPWFARSMAISEIAYPCGLAFWLWRLAQTSTAQAHIKAMIAGSASICSIIGVLLAIASLIDPQARILIYSDNLDLGADSTPRLSLLMAIGQFLIIGIGTFSVGLLAFSPIDKAERQRLTGVMIGLPIIYGGIFLPPGPEGIAHLVGLLFIMAAQLHFTMVQSQRASLISGFCSKNVANAVIRNGLESVLSTRKQKVTAIFCDIRGFTRLSSFHDSASILELLKQYYEAIGALVDRSEVTIKDYAGDGVLLLCGAPIEHEDHASMGIDFATKVLNEASRVLAPWSTTDCPVGVGVGIASGIVSVGVIGSNQRFEYSAVGSAINLASRLSDIAALNEICISASTLEQITPASLDSVDWEQAEIKGLGKLSFKRLAKTGDDRLQPRPSSFAGAYDGC